MTSCWVPQSLNRTGFSKICKKMEKNTRIPCSAWYLTNKVNPSHFVASPKLDDLSRAIEDVFAKFFEHGNRKRALERLRVLGSRKTHHESAWRSGVMMGLAIPVLVDGIVKSAFRLVTYTSGVLRSEDRLSSRHQGGDPVLARSAPDVRRGDGADAVRLPLRSQSARLPPGQDQLRLDLRV